jgi:hypothetical protein
LGRFRNSARGKRTRRFSVLIHHFKFSIDLTAGDWL